MSNEYKKQFSKVNITMDSLRGGHFVRTTDESHKRVAKIMWNKIKHKITTEQYSGWYSYNDEVFVPERIGVKTFSKHLNLQRV